MSEENKQMEQVPRPRGLLDRVLGRAVSRKLLVFVTATALLFADTSLDSETWGWVALAYIGSQGAIDAVKIDRGDE